MQLVIERKQKDQLSAGGNRAWCLFENFSVEINFYHTGYYNGKLPKVLAKSTNTNWLEVILHFKTKCLHFFVSLNVNVIYTFNYSKHNSAGQHSDTDVKLFCNDLHISTSAWIHCPKDTDKKSKCTEKTSEPHEKKRSEPHRRRKLLNWTDKKYEPI